MSERWQDTGAAPGDGNGSLSDLDDIALVKRAAREPESVEHVVEELSARHLLAVTAYASLCASAEGGAETLAAAGIRSAVLEAEPATPDEALRPRLLAAVLEVARLRWADSDSDSDRREELSADLRDWLESGPDDVPEDAGSNNAPGAGSAPGAVDPGPALLRSTFSGLPVHLQVVLWHDVVEREEPAAIGRLLGASPDTVRGWRGSARAKFRDAYLRTYADTGDSECRPFVRLVEAAAETRHISPAGDVDDHLAGCAYCRRAFEDLSRIEDDCDTLLVEGVLAWGGARYVAARLGSGAKSAGAREQAPEGPESGATELGAKPTGQEPTDELGMPAPAPHTPGPNDRGGSRRRRTTQVAITSAAVGLAVIAAAAFFASGSHDGAPQGRETARSQAGPTVSVPSRSPSPSASSEHAKPPDKKTKKPTPSPSKPPKPAVSGAALQWNFDEESGGAAVRDTSGRGNNGTVTGSGALSRGHGGSLSLNGSQYVEGAAGTIDTTRSYTVSAWLNLASKQDFSTAISQDGQEISGFFLQYDNSIDRWRLAVGFDDSSELDEDEAVSAASPVLGRWQHVVGVYDAPAREIRLYVDGQLQDTTRHTPVWSASGKFAVGRGWWEGEVADRFRGGIDAVSVFPRALSSSEVATLARTA
ncbi:LamG domain-containing protein [Streptomyces sp. HNM0575]|uniref:LamG domain-containing protein n=1 Tax=Streptomyces sp. HNM0575 TaxID=2716338 RepID=UPI00145D2F61|nr:LamG domain-containing protein [Streptomyces sp. HNM0575]NLU75271.1 LamG domain-containing protein [Streptomyces sp. HNM0575]